MLHVADLCHTATATATEPGRKKPEKQISEHWRLVDGLAGPVRWSLVHDHRLPVQVALSCCFWAHGRCFLLETAKTCVWSITFTHRPC